MEDAGQLFKSFIEKSKEKKIEDNAIIYIHHKLMKTYGWIPLNEFKELPINTVTNLIYLIDKDLEEEKKQYEKMNKKWRR